MTAIVFAAAFAGAAQARCVINPKPGLRPASPEMLSLAAKAAKQPLRLTDASEPAPETSIAGYWYVQFIADGHLVDDGFDLWHADGTEVLNDTSAPSSGNVCLGVWTKTGPSTYTLKHPSWIFDDAGVNLIGIVMIKEQITLHADGNSYSGLSTVDAYDLSGNLLQHGSALVIAKRITALDEPGPTVGIPGLPTSILNR